MSSSSTFSDSKKHYEILDALRGVAALTVVMFHILETFTNANHHIQIINHGYLAVDFFFLLSGFVIGYAYDDRWSKMRLGDFFKRRLIRLHPMIIMGMLIGALAFYFSASPELFPHLHEVPVWQLLLTMLVGFTLLPLPPAFDIRGWAEMYPLNGPAWSLFYEYVANILYALIIRQLSNTMLAVFVFLAACATIHYGVSNPGGDFVGGWSIEGPQLRVGITRLVYPFFAGLLLFRLSKPGHIPNAFLWCTLLILAALAIPRIGGLEHLWMNGLYEALCIVLLFPLIVYMGASGTIQDDFIRKISDFLGGISYPVYIVHYPLIYVYTAWVVDGKISLSEGWPMGVLLFFAAVAIAYASWRWYDIPVRKWLSAHGKTTHS